MTEALTQTVVRTFDEARAAYTEEQVLAVDLETSGFSPFRDKIHVIALHGPKSDVISILHYPDGKIPKDVIQWLGGFYELVMHNGTQFDVLFLDQNGLDWTKPVLYDTLLGERCVLGVDRWNVRVNLADTVNRRIGKKVDKTIDHGRWGADELDESQLAYVTGDIRYLVPVRVQQIDQGQQNNTLRTIEIEQQVAKPVIRMGLNGVPVDLQVVESYFEEKKDEHREIQHFLYHELGHILLSSTPQLKTALSEKFGPHLFPDTTAERLQYFANSGGHIGKVCEAILTWRHFKQRRNMFGDKWRENLERGKDGEWRVHGKLWQLGAATGRFTSSSPNLQQIPRDMKHCFGHRPGWAVGKSDYASIEVRVAAALSGDQAMIDAINRGEDIHRVVGSAMFGVRPEEITAEQRRIAKAGSFTFIFGGSAGTFRSYAAGNGSYISADDAEQARDNFFERFQGMKRMLEVSIAQADAGYPRVIVYPTGLRRVIAGSELRHTVLLNNAVQGTAAAGLKFGLIEMEKSGVSKHLLCVVHDEVVYHGRYEEIEEIRREVDRCMILGMQKALEGCIPVSVGVESTWGATWKGDDQNEVVTESGV